MKRLHFDFNDFLKESLKKPKIKTEFDRLQPEFALIEAIVKARREKGLTQAKLAKKIGTKQSAISRLERGTYNPTVAFLRTLAVALDTQLQISFSNQQR